MDSQRLEKLIEAGQELVSELDEQSVLKRILEAAREITGARYAAVGVLDEGSEELERFVTAGVDDATHAAIGDLPRGRGVLGLLIKDPKPLRLADVGAHPASYGFPASHPPMHTFLGVPIMVRGEAWGNLYLTEKRHGEFDADDQRAAVVLSNWAAIAIENARLYRDVRARRDELEQAVRGLEATTEISRALGGEIDLDRILELIVKRGRALVSASAMVIQQVRGDDVVVVAAAGEIEQSIVGFTCPLEGSVALDVLRSGRPRRLDQAQIASNVALAERMPAQAALFLPLVYRDRQLGVMAAFDRTEGGPGFRPDDERLMTAFAASAAMALATGQSAAEESLRRSMEAAEQERTRWSRELHDDTLQQLGALKLLLAGARRASDPEAVGAAIDEVIAELGTGIASLRGLITDLRPAALDEIGPAAAIEALVERTRAVAGLDIELELELDYEAGRADARHEPEIEATVYRLVQEALTNVVKHARAATAIVSVVETNGLLRVRVGDDGAGFDTEASSGGFGLVGMRERLALVGGRLELASIPGEGTTVLAELPARRRAVPAAPPG